MHGGSLPTRVTRRMGRSPETSHDTPRTSSSPWLSRGTSQQKRGSVPPAETLSASTSAL